MKPRNNKDIRTGILHFSLYLVASVLFAVFAYYCFMRTSSEEVDRILAKAVEYDNVQMKQIKITEGVDTIFYYMNVLTSAPNINSLMMYNYVSDRKIAVTNEITSLESKDVAFYKKLSPQLNYFLGLKDSIRTFRRDEEMLKSDLDRCISDNKKITRRMSIGGLTYK